ncbi:MAG: hypothetical protein Q7T11_06845 [Deltaproteobacteria bacterium]|nr:hypothetical protein [Deltaproteobacteria bacterium]
MTEVNECISPATPEPGPFCEESPEPADICQPDEKPSGFDFYDVHRLGRQAGPAANVTVSWIGASGQYRINYSLFTQNPGHPVFAESAANFYRNDHWAGRLSQRAFLPEEFRGRPLSAEEASELRKSGARRQQWAGRGLQVQLAIRAISNATSLGKVYSEGDGELAPAKTSAVVLDTVSVGLDFAEVNRFGRGLEALVNGLEEEAPRLLGQSHVLNQVGGILQAGSGGVRLAIEIHEYSQTGNLDASATFYASADTAQGVTSVAYSTLLLRQAQAAGTVAAETNILLHITKMGPILRVVGAAGAGFGLAVNIYAYLHASSETEQTAGILGIIGSGMMVGASLLATTAAAPVAAGLLAAVGLIFLISQSALLFADSHAAQR